MDKQELINLIKTEHFLRDNLFVSQVTCGTIVHFGFFQEFVDSQLLEKQDKYRFVPIEFSDRFKKNVSKLEQITNVEDSIIIDLFDVTDLKLLERFK